MGDAQSAQREDRGEAAAAEQEAPSDTKETVRTGPEPVRNRRGPSLDNLTKLSVKQNDPPPSPDASLRGGRSLSRIDCSRKSDLTDSFLSVCGGAGGHL